MVMGRNALRFSNRVCPVCGSRAVARDEMKGITICTNCGAIIESRDTKRAHRFDIAQLLARENGLTFQQLLKRLGVSEASLYSQLESMISMDYVVQIGNIYKLTRRGSKWYHSELGKQWGY